VAAADIPVGRSTVSVVVTGSWHQTDVLVMALARNSTGSFEGQQPNLFSAQVAGGVWAATVVDNVGPGTYFYRIGYVNTFPPGMTDSLVVLGNVPNLAITVVLGKR
jgi:hypothetical protein